MRTLALAPLALLALAGCSKPTPINQNHTGRLETGDEVLTVDNSLFDKYEFDAAEGMTITATMNSTDFDAYLHLMDNDDNMLIQNDDMAAGNTNAQLTFVANRTGKYTILANAHSQGMQGAYTLNIVTTAPAGAAQ